MYKRQGDHVVAQKTIYGGSYNLLEHTLSQFGVETTFVDAHNLDEVEGAIKDNTTVIYLETLGNQMCIRDRSARDRHERHARSCCT